ncbi:hypothetical protein H0H93_007178 [Arthromyces matolae]|nr:hypothetical protein H0H93_007178 [Arthromyces matolae]
MLLKAKFIQTITVACFLQAALSLPISSDHALLDHTSPTGSLDAGNSQSNDAQGQNLHRSLDFTGEPQRLIRNTLHARSSGGLTVAQMVTQERPVQPRNDTPDRGSNGPPSSLTTNRASLGHLETSRISPLVFPNGDKLADYLNANPSSIPEELKGKWDECQQSTKAFSLNQVSKNFCQAITVLMDKMRLVLGSHAPDLRPLQEMGNLILSDSLEVTPQAKNMAIALQELFREAPDEKSHIQDCEDSRDAMRVHDLHIAVHQTLGLHLRRRVLAELRKSPSSDLRIVVSNQIRYARNVLNAPQSLDQEKSAAEQYLAVLKEMSSNISEQTPPSTNGKRGRGDSFDRDGDSITAQSGQGQRPHNRRRTKE